MNSYISFSPSIRNLGLVIDQELNWKSHTTNQCLKALNILRQLYKIRDCLTQQIKLYLTNVLILPLFDYCDAVYGPNLSGRRCMAIQKVHNSCIRFVFNVRKGQHILPVLNSNNILTMSRRRYLHYCCLIYKVLKSKTPPYLYQKFITRFHIHSYKTRNNKNLDMPRHKLKIVEGSFSVSAVRAWNALPTPLRDINTFCSFKSAVKLFLHKNQQLTTSTHDKFKYV